MAKISMTQALVELKSAKARSNRNSRNSSYIAVTQGTRDKTTNGVTRAEFEKKAKSDLQSVTDLFARRMALKTAIIESNAKTIVTIGKKDMTVAAAIEYKEVVKGKREFLNGLYSQIAIAEAEVSRGNQETEKQLQNLINTKLGAANNSKDAGLEELMSTYRKANEFSIFDPTNLKGYVEELEKELTEIENNIDFVLSASNAQTQVEV